MKAKAGVNSRKKAALKRLIEQLAKGQKPAKIDGKTVNTHFVLLTDKDKTRIQREIDVLKEKLKGQLTEQEVTR